MDLMKVKYLKKWEFCREGRIYRQEREIAEQNIKDGYCEEVKGITKEEIDFHRVASGQYEDVQPKKTIKKTTIKK